MKTIYKLPKSINFLLIISLIIMGTSCKDQKSQENLKDQVDQLEDDDSFAGSSKRDDICQLLTKDDIRSVFDLSDAIKLKQEKDKDAICSYNWEASGEKFMRYTVMLNFASGGKRTDSQIAKAWEQQNKVVFSKRNMQSVSGVGDRASWSDLGGGQLRVAVNGYIFYVSHSVMVMPDENKPSDTQGMIDKTSTLAKRVIKRM